MARTDNCELPRPRNPDFTIDGRGGAGGQEKNSLGRRCAFDGERALPRKSGPLRDICTVRHAGNAPAGSLTADGAAARIAGIARMDPLLASPARLIGDVFALIYRDAVGYAAQLGPDGVLALSGDVDA